MSADTLSKIYHDQKDSGFLGGVERLLQRARQLHVLGVAENGPEIPKKRAGLYAAQAGAPSVYQKPYLCGGDWCSVAGRFGRYAEYRQAKQRNEVFAHRDWCIFQVRMGGAGPL